MPALGVYLHFPWCVRKCPYCDFNSHPLKGSLDEAGYVAALEADLTEAAAGVAASAIGSVFCGGGTPSLFHAESFQRLLEALGPRLSKTAEITMEANPGTVEHHDFAAYRTAGITRLSLGAQSFEARQLAALGRIHGAGDTARAFLRAREGGFEDINLDLMYGLPGQTAAHAIKDLEQAVALGPEHLSWYQLTIEPKTEFARRPPTLATDAEIAVMERDGLALLGDAGYERYEVSAFARAGHRSRHNLNYWTFGDYLGAGAGAHGKLTRGDASERRVVRTRKPNQPRLYLGDPLYTERTEVSRDQLVFEFMMNALRLVHGVDAACFESRTGLSRRDLDPVWEGLVADGLARSDRIATTAFGLRHLDGVLQRFLT